jgi:hypothetical protein
MVAITYSLRLSKDGHLIVNVTRKRPDMVYLPGKTRAELTCEVLFHMRVLDVPVNKDRLQRELDEMIWNKLPRHKWY